MSDSVNYERGKVLYTNLMLLGFSYTSNSHTKVSVDMFNVPNKSGFEVVAYFLFSRLDAARAKEEFRSCWPIVERKCEQLFRRICNDWLAQISRDDLEANLPRIVPSLFQSPGGEKFTHLMYSFSNYVLLQVAKKEHGLKTTDYIARPILTPDNLEFAEPMLKSCQCAEIHHRKMFFDKIQLREKLQKKWSQSARNLTNNYRKLCKQIRNKESDIQVLLQTCTDKGMKTPVRLDASTRRAGTPSKHGKVFDLNMESVKRNEKVEKVRDLWRIVEGFLCENRTDQEVVSTIISGVSQTHHLNADHLNVQVPELLLRECEKEIIKRDIDSTYRSGQLDLLSVIQLWNLCLHLYLEQFEELSVPDLSQNNEELVVKLQHQQTQLEDLTKIRHTVEDKMIPMMSESVDNLEKRYHSQYAPRTTSLLGMSLVPPTPELNLNNKHDMQTPDMFKSATPDTNQHQNGSTPDVAQRILNALMNSSQKKLTNQSSMPVKSTNQSYIPVKSTNQSAIPVKTTNQDTTPVRPTRATHLSPLAQGSPSRSRTLLASKFDFSPCKGDVEVMKVGKKQITQIKGRNSPQPGSSTTRAVQDILTTPTGKTHPGTTSPVLSKQEALLNLSQQIDEQREKIQDILAEQIAAEAVNDSDGSIPSGRNSPFSIISQLEPTAFEKKDKIARTPDTSSILQDRSTRDEGLITQASYTSPKLNRTPKSLTKDRHIYTPKHDEGAEDDKENNGDNGSEILTIEADDSLGDITDFLTNENTNNATNPTSNNNQQSGERSRLFASAYMSAKPLCEIRQNHTGIGFLSDEQLMDMDILDTP